MVLEARDLTNELGGRMLYQDLDLRVESGRTLGIRGPSGAGKTQLLRQLAGLDPSSAAGLRQSGDVTFRGRGMAQWGAYAWRAEVCYVPQVVPRLQGSPADLARRLAGFRAQRTRRAADPFVLAEEFGISAVLWERPWSGLSVGERQRALLALLVSRAPGVLLLDEPTSALDQEATLRVEERLRGETCIWVTHSSEQARRMADDVLILGGAGHAD